MKTELKNILNYIQKTDGAASKKIFKSYIRKYNSFKQLCYDRNA